MMDLNRHKNVYEKNNQYIMKIVEVIVDVLAEILRKSPIHIQIVSNLQQTLKILIHIQTQQKVQVTGLV
jgi:hypothetical protein